MPSASATRSTSPHTPASFVSKKPHTCISNHRGDFDIDEETLPFGTALYAAYALSVLDPQFAK